MQDMSFSRSSSGSGLDRVVPDLRNDRQIHGARWLLICMEIYSSNLLYGLDNTIVADIQGVIASEFLDYSRLGWLGVGFTLGSVVSILPLGKAYSMFDAKMLFFCSLVIFAGGSALCGAAPSMNAIIIGRVVAGMGGAGMYLGNINIITSLTTLKEQPRFIGVIGFVYGTGCILGPIVGGAFADSPATWRWSFYINLVIIGIMSPVYIILLPGIPNMPEQRSIHKVQQFDWLGVLLSAGAHVSGVCFMTFGDTEWKWQDHRNIALYAVCVLFTIVFVATQCWSILTTKANRIFPGDFLKSTPLVSLYVLTTCGGFVLFVSLYYIPLYFQFIRGDTGVRSAVRLLPFICLYVGSILLCGYLMPKTGNYYLWYAISGLLIVSGASLMQNASLDTRTGHIYGYSALLGLGMCTTQASYAVGPLMVSSDRIPDVIQFMNIAQGQGQMLGLAMASALFQSYIKPKLEALLRPQGLAVSEISSTLGGAQSLLLEGLSTEIRRKSLQVIIDGISQVYILAIVAGAVYVLASMTLRLTLSI